MQYTFTITKKKTVGSNSNGKQEAGHKENIRKSVVVQKQKQNRSWLTELTWVELLQNMGGEYFLSEAGCTWKENKLNPPLRAYRKPGTSKASRLLKNNTRQCSHSLEACRRSLDKHKLCEPRKGNKKVRLHWKTGTSVYQLVSVAEYQCKSKSRKYLPKETT